MWANHDTTAPKRTPGNHDNTRSNHEDPGRHRRGGSPIDRGTGACQRRTRFQRRASLPLAGLRTPRRSNTKASEMLPLSATLSHEKSMSPKSESPTRPCTCARNFRLRRARDNTRKKHTPCTVGCTVGKRAQIPERRPSQSPPRCRSGDRPDGQARHLVRPSDCRARQERRVGVGPPDRPAGQVEISESGSPRSIGQAVNADYE